jgi:hypothetical protein
MVPYFLHGEAEFGDYLFEGNPGIMFEPLARFGDGAFFLFSDRLVVNGGIGEGAGDRIEHYFHHMDHRGDLIGRQMIEQLPGVFYIGVHIWPH